MRIRFELNGKTIIGVVEQVTASNNKLLFNICNLGDVVAICGDTIDLTVSMDQLLVNGYLDLQDSACTLEIEGERRVVFSDPNIDDYVSWFDRLKTDDVKDVCKGYRKIAEAIVYRSQSLAAEVGRASLDFASTYYTQQIMRTPCTPSQAIKLSNIVGDLTDNESATMKLFRDNIYNAMCNGDTAYLCKTLSHNEATALLLFLKK
ncbi:MAG: hypothetical protein NC548_30705 [Lachnospiraceae bacterium]|nr:hypothetical protein [Lachnospiraceae bacterium]